MAGIHIRPRNLVLCMSPELSRMLSKIIRGRYHVKSKSVSGFITTQLSLKKIELFKYTTFY
jgi:hypothetical protein